MPYSVGSLQMRRNSRSAPSQPSTAMHDYPKMILSARVYDVAIESPLDRMPRMSERLGATVFLKREDLQPVFSFKLRGAYNKIVGLSPEVRARGIITASTLMEGVVRGMTMIARMPSRCAASATP